MSFLAPTLQSFFTEHLIRQRQVSPKTITAYRDAYRLLLEFVHQETNKTPSAVTWDDLDAPVIAAFLDYLEVKRKNTPRTCNARLATVRSLFRYAA